MNYGVTREDFQCNGTISKEVSKTLSGATQVITYLKNKDKSTNYKYLFGVGECRTRLLHAYVKAEHGMVSPPKLDECLELAFNNFNGFKKWLNSNLQTF
ncbi:hypothetical protein [Mucilaginibacter sp. 10I4]|uniref:hypothetical protein n=1 Tax=Mucilaginibacter sp. 10I4 TaxID=3048580 RepID=UPI002B222B0A|nr:hypothetical protein [Mucilaginibacter sp. 10I4]MEB0262909.1 hypothetical protein [Mucilaginibacter sp. 10I4]